MNHHPKQREPRYPARLQITLGSGAQTQRVYTDNVSYRGLFACTDSPPVLRQLISIEAELPPGNVKFRSHGMSVFVREPRDARGKPPGVGIQFYAQGNTDRKNWEAFIQFVKQGNWVGPPPDKDPEPPPVRRQHPRYPARLAVRPRNLGELQILYSRDVSKGGMFLATALPVPQGTELQLHVHHPTSNHVFPLDAVVRRVNQQPAGIGVEFLRLDDARRDKFLQFVKGSLERLDTGDIEIVAEDDPKLA